MSDDPIGKPAKDFFRPADSTEDFPPPEILPGLRIFWIYAERSGVFGVGIMTPEPFRPDQLRGYMLLSGVVPLVVNELQGGPLVLDPTGRAVLDEVFPLQRPEAMPTIIDALTGELTKAAYIATQHHPIAPQLPENRPVDNRDEFALCCPRRLMRRLTGDLTRAGLPVTQVKDARRTGVVWLCVPCRNDLASIDAIADALADIAMQLHSRRGGHLEYTIPGSAGVEWAALLQTRLQSDRHPTARSLN